MLKLIFLFIAIGIFWHGASLLNGDLLSNTASIGEIVSTLVKGFESLIIGAAGVIIVTIFVIGDSIEKKADLLGQGQKRT